MQAAADAAEFEQLRESVLGLPPTAPALPPHGLARGVAAFPPPPPPPPAPSHPQQQQQGAQDEWGRHWAVLQQYGRRLTPQGGGDGTREGWVAAARWHLAGLEPDQTTLADLELITRDYPLLLQQPGAMRASAQRLYLHLQEEAERQQQQQRLGLLVDALHKQGCGLRCTHLVAAGGHIRVGDVPALLADYRQLVHSTLLDAGA